MSGFSPAEIFNWFKNFYPLTVGNPLILEVGGKRYVVKEFTISGKLRTGKWHPTATLEPFIPITGLDFRWVSFLAIRYSDGHGVYWNGRPVFITKDTYLAYCAAHP